MKIVIDIDENIYHRFVNGFANEDDAHLIEQLFKNGTLLPKGHGDLIDRDALIQKQLIPNHGFEFVDLNDLKIAPTVIPADK